MTKKRVKGRVGGGKKLQEQPHKTPAKRTGKLKTASDVAKFMARCIRRAERGGEGGDSNQNYKLVTMASMLLKALEVSDLEARIRVLERASSEEDQ